MSTMHPTQDKLNDTDRRDSFELMTPREQLQGILMVLLALLLALALKSL